MLLATSTELSIPDNPAWLGMILAFILAESTIIHFEFRKQTVSWPTSEIPMVVGLFLIGPAATVIASAAAVAIVVVKTGYRPAKVVFNVAVAVIEAALFGWLLRGLDLQDVASPLMWLWIIVALLLTGATSIGCIALAILVTEGTVSPAFWLTLVIPLLVIVPMSAAVGIVVLLLIDASPWALILAAIVLSAFVLLYRRYAAAAQDRRSLSEVHEFSQRIQNTGNDGDGELVILTAVREKFNAARAALWLPAFLDQGPRLRAVAEGGTTSYPGPDDPDDVIRQQTASSQRARLVAVGGRPTTDELAALRRRGVSELIGVPLEIATHEPGYLEVCDRNGAVLQFSSADVELMQSLATHVAGAVRARQLLDKIRYDAAHDQVTDLPNRFWLTATIDAQLAAVPPGQRLGLIVATIDGFAQVNETLGHAAGDELLRVVAGALAEHVSPDARVTSLGGPQFAVVLPEADIVRAEAEAARLARDVPSRVQVAGLQLTAGLTLGIAVAPLHGNSAGPLLQRADVAVLAARTLGSATATYSPAMDEGSFRRLRLAADLADAIESSQISVVFQPIVGAATGEIVAVELLSRWTHPDLGSVSPEEFIPLAERIGQVTPLTRRVLRTALQRGRAWLGDGIAISVAVNLSTVSLTEPGFVEEVAETLREHAFPAELLILEITEGRVVGEALALPALEQLHGLGVRLSVDDFGTGYSS
ncbi:MAG: EAL domain-containing protein, partial [Actinomycetota bacterium]|nr:EAL domain-containing protein [Actinomycetota bacterium]